MPVFCTTPEEFENEKININRDNDPINNLIITPADLGYKEKPQNSPPQLNTFFLGKSSEFLSAAKEMINKRLAIGNDPRPYLDSFDSFKLRVFKSSVNSSPLNVNEFNSINGYGGTNSDAWEYSIIGVNGDVQEVIGVFNQDVARRGKPQGYFRKLTKLYDWLNKNKSENKNEFDALKNNEIAINKDMLISLVDKLSKPQLSKSMENSTPERKSFTLNDLKTLHGEDYPYMFSNIYIITDTNNAIKNKDLVGSSVIFYSKFPKKGDIVDDIVRELKTNTENELGYITLNDGVLYSSVDELLGIVNKMGGVSTYSNRRVLVSDTIINSIIAAIQRNTKSEFDFSDIINQYVTNGDRLKPSHKINYSEFISLLKRITQNPELKAEIDDILTGNTELEPGKRLSGVHISPVLLSANSLMSSSLAIVDESSSDMRDLLDNNLIITGLNENILNSPGIDLNFSSNEEEMLTQFNMLFDVNTSITTTKLRSSDIIKDETARLIQNKPPLDLRDRRYGNANKEGMVESKTTLEDIMEPFESLGFGFSTADLENFVLNDINGIVMGEKSINFTESLKNWMANQEQC